MCVAVCVAMCVCVCKGGEKKKNNNKNKNSPHDLDRLAATVFCTLLNFQQDASLIVGVNRIIELSSPPSSLVPYCVCVCNFWWLRCVCVEHGTNIK